MKRWTAPESVLSHHEEELQGPQPEGGFTQLLKTVIDATPIPEELTKEIEERYNNAQTWPFEAMAMPVQNQSSNPAENSAKEVKSPGTLKLSDPSDLGKTSEARILSSSSSSSVLLRYRTGTDTYPTSNCLTPKWGNCLIGFLIGAKNPAFLFFRAKWGIEQIFQNLQGNVLNTDESISVYGNVLTKVISQQIPQNI